MNLVIDLDDTLVYTTFLNNDAYNFALEKYGYPRLDDKDRITIYNGLLAFRRKAVKHLKHILVYSNAILKCLCYNKSRDK